jgi:hypothetical protein
MKYVIICLFFYTNIYAQTNYEFVGFLFNEQGFPISYQLILEEEEGLINGYSITGIGTNYETKNEVLGELKKKKIQLQEYQIITTVSEEPLSTFCFIEVSASLEKKVFTGTFTGRYPDSTICAQGKVTFAEKAVINKKIKKFERVLQVQELIAKRKENKVLHLKSGDVHTINWNSNKFKINLWDSAIEDGDRITLIINGQEVLSNKEMVSKKEKIVYDLLPGDNIVKLQADSEGKINNNTTRIELLDKRTKHAVLSELQVGKALTFKIIRP